MQLLFILVCSMDSQLILWNQKCSCKSYFDKTQFPKIMIFLSMIVISSLVACSFEISYSYYHSDTKVRHCFVCCCLFCISNLVLLTMCMPTTDLLKFELSIKGIQINGQYKIPKGYRLEGGWYTKNPRDQTSKPSKNCLHFTLPLLMLDPAFCCSLFPINICAWWFVKQF